MRKIISSLVLTLLIAGGIFYACTKSETPDKIAEKEPTRQLEVKCCEITCSNGSKCTAYGTGSCSCSCDWFGNADCDGNGSPIIGPSSLSDYYAGLISLLETFNNSHSNQSIADLSTIKSLFETNNFNIQSPSGIASYNAAVASIKATQPAFSSAEVAAVNNYRDTHTAE